jgi:mevalonate kinase
VSLSISSQFLGTSSTATSGTNITRFSISGTTLSHSSMGANVGYDRVYVKAVNNGNTSVTNSANTYVQNVKDAWSQITAWGTPTISGVSYSKHGIYPSSTYGDACKPTVTASVTNTRTYYYTSNSVSRTVSEAGNYVLSYAKTSSYAGIASVSDATVNATNGYVTFTKSGGGTDVQNDRVCWVIVTATNSSDSTKKTNASPCAAY